MGRSKRTVSRSMPPTASRRDWVVWARQETREDRLTHRAGVARHGDRHAKRVADRLMFAEQDVEYDPVDAVVGAVVGRHPYFRTALAEAVDPAFPLFVAGRVPRQ